MCSHYRYYHDFGEGKVKEVAAKFRYIGFRGGTSLEECVRVLNEEYKLSHRKLKINDKQDLLQNLKRDNKGRMIPFLASIHRVGKPPHFVVVDNIKKENGVYKVGIRDSAHKQRGYSGAYSLSLDDFTEVFTGDVAMY